MQNPPNFYPYVNLPGRGGVYQSVNLNLYQYGTHNPLIYVDPDGKLAFYWHFIISFSESQKAGLGFWKGLAVGWNAMVYDFRGTQGKDPASANSHAMRAIDRATGREQSVEQAATETDAFITGRLEQGTLRGLGEATHPGPDKPAGGHEGKVWEGFRKLGVWGSIKHIWADMFPSADVRDKARENVRGTIERWKEMQGNKQAPAEQSKPAPAGD